MAEVDLALALARATSVRKLDRSWISAVKPEDALKPPSKPALVLNDPQLLEVVSPYGRSVIGTINLALRRVQRIGGRRLASARSAID
jgi:hypothetical protein